jgi:predicted ATPase
VLLRIAKDTDRKFIISTHSEHLVIELLNALVKQTAIPDDVRIYYLYKERSKTIIENQTVSSNGQIEGGLKSFYETELEQMRDFIGVQGDK